jgi:hypothetical protein
LFAQNVGIAFTVFCKVDDLRRDGLFDAVVAVANPQGDADQFERESHDAPIFASSR